MTRVSNLAVALGAALALGACAGEGGQMATSPEAPAFQTAAGTLACNLTELRKATSALFGNKHPANEIAKQFTSKNQNGPASVGLAYNLFAEIEAKRQGSNSWATGDPEKGAELTIQVIACSDVVYTDDALQANSAAARSALLRALDFEGTGTYGVRGGGSDASLAAKNQQAALGANGGTLTNLLGARSLIIGYTIPPFDGEEDYGVFYDWSMVRPNPAAALNGLATVSYCAPTAPLAEGPSLRIQHYPTAANGVILPVAGPAAGTNCVNSASLGNRMGESFAVRILHGLINVVRPAPLFATSMAFGPVSGTLGDFSPTAVVDPGETLMSFAVQPTSGVTNTPLPVSVLVTGAGGTPWKGIEIEITAAENNGETLNPCGTTATTDSVGLAVFPNFQINKPGIVHLTAKTVNTDPDLVAYPVDSVISNSFVVTGAGNAGCQE